MSEKRILEVGYVEYPDTSLYYKAIKINVNDYPELEGKSDDEIIEYVKKNAFEMPPSNSDWYDSLGEEIQDQDLVREKIPSVDYEVWASFDIEEEEDDDE